MTDILTKLTALTGTDPKGTTPRPWSVGAQNPMTGEVNVHHEYRDPSFTTTGGRGIRVVAALGNRFRRELDDEARANAELIVQTMNREQALIALVREAAGEIERFRNTLHEGLNLCVRARKLDTSITAEKCREMGSYHPDHVNCGTPHLWVLEQYDSDLAAWEVATKTILGIQP